MKYFTSAIFFLVLGSVLTAYGLKVNMNESPVVLPVLIAGSFLLVILSLSMHFLHSLESMDHDKSHEDPSESTTPVEVTNLDMDPQVPPSEETDGRSHLLDDFANKLRL